MSSCGGDPDDIIPSPTKSHTCTSSTCSTGCSNTTTTCTTTSQDDTDDKSHRCYKCKEMNACVYLPNLVSCKSCFLLTFNNRFKTSIRRRSPISREHRLLIAFSGGMSSSCMTHACTQATERNIKSTRGIHFDLVHIDETEILPEQDGATLESSILSLASQYGCHIYHIPLSLVMTLSHDITYTPTTPPIPTGTTIHTLSTTPEAKHALQSLFTSIRASHSDGTRITAQQDLLSLLRARLLIHIAHTYGYVQMAMGESATHTAFTVMSATAKGRGYTLPWDIATTDTRWGMTCHHPMRDVLIKSIALYNHFHGVENVTVQDWSTMARKGKDINMLTEQFINTLQSKFGNTVSNILRTCEKLIVPTVGKHQHICRMCGRYIAPPLTSVFEPAIAAPTSTSTSTFTSTSTSTRVLRHLCYSCHVIIKNVDITLLPPYITRHPDEPDVDIHVNTNINEHKQSDAHDITPPTTTTTTTTTTSHHHHRIIKQSKEEIKSSISEFLLDENDTS